MNFDFNKVDLVKILEEKSWASTTDYLLLLPFLDGISNVNEKLTIRGESRTLLGFLLSGSLSNSQRAPVLFPEFALDKDFTFTNTTFESLKDIKKELYFIKSYITQKLLSKGANPWLGSSQNELPEEVEEAILSDDIYLFNQFLKLPKSQPLEEIMQMKVSIKGKNDPKTAWSYLASLEVNSQARFSPHYFNCGKNKQNILKNLFSQNIFSPDFKNVKNHPFTYCTPEVLNLLLDYDYFSDKSDLLEAVENTWLSGKRKDYLTQEIQDTLKLINDYKSNGDNLKELNSDRLDIVQYLSFKKKENVYVNNFFNSDKVNLDKVELYNDIVGLPGSWCKEGVFIHSLIKNETFFYGNSGLDGFDYEKLKKIKLGDGQFSLMTLALLCKDENTVYKTNEEDIKEMFGYFSYLFKNKLEKSFNVSFLEKVKNIFKVNGKDNLIFKTDFINKLHGFLCNKENPIKINIEKANSMNDVFKKYAEEQILIILNKCHSENTSFLVELEKAENIKEVYMSLIHAGSHITSQTIFGFTNGLFNSSIKARECLINNFEQFPRKDILEELILELPEKYYPEFKNLKNQIKIEKNLSSQQEKIKPSRF